MHLIKIGFNGKEMRSSKLESNPAVAHKQRIRRIIKEEGLCIYCAQKGGSLYVGENEGKAGRRDKRNWKRKRTTKYKEIAG